MKEIRIKSLSMRNFKGAREADYEFGARRNAIRGRNASGKTTIADAVTWALFGVDSAWNAKFDIRPLDAAGNREHDLDISVALVLEADGAERTFARGLRENWVTRRGTGERALQGNVGSYEVDGFPRSEAEYRKAVAELIGEEEFKLLSSPSYLPSLPWKEQREAVMRLSSCPPDAELARGSAEFAPLADELEKGSADDVARKCRKALSEWKAWLDEIPARIDELEAQRSGTAGDADAIGAEVAAIKAEAARPDAGASARRRLADELAALEGRLAETERAAGSELAAARAGLAAEIAAKREAAARARSEARLKEMAAREAGTRMERLEAERNALAGKWKAARAEEFDASSAECPTCHRPLPEADAARMRGEFEEARAARLEDIERRGGAARKGIAEAAEAKAAAENAAGELSAEAASLEGDALELEGRLAGMPERADLAGDAAHASLLAEIAAKREELGAVAGGGAEARMLGERLSDAQRRLAEAEQDARLAARVEELRAEQRGAAQKAADQEGRLALLEKFTRHKLDRISGEVNSKFGSARFKLFDAQLNGGTKETCEITVGGVPWGSLNSGHRLMAGLEIVAAMQEHYGARVFVIADNCETANAWNIPDTGGQMLLLYVDDGDLRVEPE